MKKFRSYFWKLARNKSGQTLVEYALLLTLVSIIVIAALTAIGGDIQQFFSDISAELASATGGS